MVTSTAVRKLVFFIKPQTCTLAPHIPYIQVPPMDRCSVRGISNPTLRFHSRMNPELALSLWCSLLDGECSRAGRNGSDGRQVHTGQEESRRQSQRWSGTSCSLLNVVCRLPPSPQQFSASAQSPPRILAGPTPQLVLDQIPCEERCNCSLEHHHPYHEKVFKPIRNKQETSMMMSLSSPVHLSPSRT